MVISSNGEREAARNSFPRPIGTFKGTARKHGLLGVVKGDGTELLPVADQLILDDDLVDGEFTLSTNVN